MSEHQHAHRSQNDSHLAIPDLPSQIQLSPSSSLDRSLTFDLSQDQLQLQHQCSEQQQHQQRGRPSFFYRKSGNSRPGSRATTRSRQSRNSSRSNSRPASWLINAHSEYTSLYDNFGGSRSTRDSLVAEDDIAAAEKGVYDRFSRHSSRISDAESSHCDAHREQTAASAYHNATNSSSHANINEDGSSTSSDESGSTGPGTVSSLKAGFLLGKAFVGTGILFLPRAFKNGGLLFSCLMLTVVAIICFVAFLLLVKVRLVIRENFQDMGLALYGKYMRLTVLLAVALSQIGFVCAYLIFISQNIHAVVQTFTECKFYGIQEKYYILLPLVLLIPLVLIRRMAVLSIPSMFANLFIIFGIVYLWYYSINSLVHHGAGPDIGLFNKDDFALFIGTAVFSFEGIGLIIPITESMAEPEKFPRVLAITMTIVTIIFSSVGVLCYSAFGINIQTIVLLNLPIKDGMTITVEILYSCAIILSVPLMLSPASRIVEHGIFGDKSGGDYLKVKMQKNALRTVLICCCALLSFAIGGPNLDKFVSFVGCVACTPLCFIFPAMFHYRACAKTMRVKVLDILLGIFGATVMIYTIYITIRSWVAPGTIEIPLDRCSAFA
ncbi:neutral amino acid transporter [Dissophora globulifera]|nr:neutral amino acid transporter [Dissophora globulifera]